MSSLMHEVESLGIEVYEFDFTDQLKGLYYENIIAIKKGLSEEERNCVLAEELGHHKTSFGDITDPNKLESRKQEKKARIWAYKKLIPIEDLIKAAISCEGYERWELAHHLGVTDEFLCDTLEAYKSHYGSFFEYKDYCIYFDPLTVAHFKYRS